MTAAPLFVGTSVAMLEALGLDEALVLREGLWSPWKRGLLPFRTTFWPTYPTNSRSVVSYFVPERPSRAHFLTREEATAMLGEIASPEEVRLQLRAAATAHTLRSIDARQQEINLDPVTALYWAHDHTDARNVAHRIARIDQEETTT